MSANTPITWRYERETEFNCSAIIASNGNIICEFADEPEEQYAELIAAAPELLGKLTVMTDAYAEAMKDAGFTRYPEALAVVRAARAAIAKAKGGAA